MASAVDICNLALANIGQQPIAKLPDSSASSAAESEAAIACGIFYNHTRKAMLAEHPWVFARKVVTLAQTSDDPVYGYAYRFALPTDCLRPLELTGADWPDCGGRRSAPFPESNGFRIIGRDLLTNREAAVLAYTCDEKDPNRFNMNFIDALAYRLAAALAGQLSDSAGLQKNMSSLYQNALAIAKAVDASANRSGGRPTVISVRR